METVVDEGPGDAALMSATSKEMMSEMWPVMRAKMYKCPASFKTSLMPDWKTDRELTAVRIAVKDDSNADAMRHGARVDIGEIMHVYPDDLATFVMDWRHVVPFLRRRPGIDIVIIEGAATQKSGGSFYYFEYAVILALLHLRRWLVSYPCAMLAVYPDRRSGWYGTNRTRFDVKWFEQSFSSLMMANSNRLFPKGPKVVYWGKGVDVRDVLQGMDRKNNIDMAVGEGTSTLCVESGAARDVFERTPARSKPHLVLVVRGAAEQAHEELWRARTCGFASVAIAGASEWVRVPAGTYHCVGDAAIEVTGPRDVPTEVVQWGDGMATADSRLALDSMRVRSATKREREEMVKRFPLMWSGLVF
eukprot:jgi/Mesvir1/14608/Mv05278-RA.1